MNVAERRDHHPPAEARPTRDEERAHGGQRIVVAVVASVGALSLLRPPGTPADGPSLVRDRDDRRNSRTA
jgi:hypothetical protein